MQVVSAYLDSGAEFVVKAISEDKFLEQFTGLADFHKMSENIDIIALDDSDNESSISNGSFPS